MQRVLHNTLQSKTSAPRVLPASFNRHAEFPSFARHAAKTVKEALHASCSLRNAGASSSSPAQSRHSANLAFTSADSIRR